MTLREDCPCERQRELSKCPGAAQGWYLVQCKPREGFKAEQHLRNQGFQCFHPTIQNQSKRRGKARWVVESLFPYYLFLHVRAGQALSNVRHTRGVVKLVGFGEGPRPVSSGIVRSLMRYCRAIRYDQTEELLHPGDSVRIVDGCFNQLDAVVKAGKGEDRVVVLLDILNRQQELELPLSEVQPS
ncbi:transcription/translation regulatory transformer protein RfaH [Saccharospirillum salsuginis]|uniref:transcription/translation regulatory transformer protein RfaH n=1 Tax=Saccharospirillum salsuginis TaxID=418750 RepID=UPI0016760E61